MVPDFFGVRDARGQPQIDLGLALSHRGIFGLAVHSQWLAGNSQLPGHFCRAAVSAVSGFDGFADPPGLGLTDIQSAGVSIAVQRFHPTPIAADGRVERTGCRVIGEWQIGTAQHADGHVSFDDQGQGDGVLAAAQISLGAVDGIQCPESITIILCATGVDPVTDVVFRYLQSGLFQFVLNVFQERFLVGLPQGIGVLFANDGIVWEGTPQSAADHGLAGEVSHRHGAAVLFLQNFGHQCLAHVMANPRGMADCCLGDLEFFLQVLHHSIPLVSVVWRVPDFNVGPSPAARV